MPMYEFRCPGCGSVISRLSRLDEDGVRLSCASCGHVGLEKQFSVFSSPKSTASMSVSDLKDASCHGCGDLGSCPRRPQA